MNTASKTILERFIRKVVDETMIEMAKEPHEAEAGGFALSIVNNGPNMYLVLYQPVALEKICSEIVQQPDHLKFDDKLDAVLYMNPNPVVGFIRMKKDNCGWIIQNSAANKGYGPMMYDIAFSYAGKQGIIPDRDSVSKAARAIWRYYMTNRKNEFRVYPLSHRDPCVAYQDEDDSWFLDVRYIMRNPDPSKAAKLLAKGKQTLQKIDQTSEGKLQADMILRTLASSFFDQMY